MTLYVDASALVKRYVTERGSEAVTALMEDVAVVATSIVSRAEVGAALAGAVRRGVLDEPDGRRARLQFGQEWPDIARIPVTEGLVTVADALAWEHGLRGYDAVQLASAAHWQDMVGSDVVLATFDRQLWNAAQTTGLQPWPPRLPE